MQIDLLTFLVFAEEIESKLVDSRLQKIIQPGESEFIFRFRLAGENFFLYYLIDEEHSRIHPVPEKFSTSVNPTPFCMLLRKHLEGERLLYVDNAPGDRIIKMVFSSHGEGESQDEKTLIFELTGKSSNLILLDGAYNYIRAFANDPRREIITGSLYEPPPPPAGINPLLIDKPRFLMLFESQKFAGAMIKDLLLKAFYGVQKSYALEILFHSGIGAETPIENISSRQKDRLWNSWQNFFTRFTNRQISPCIYYDKDDLFMEKDPVRWTLWEFDVLRDYPVEKVATISEALSACFFPKAIKGNYEELKSDLISAVKKQVKKVERRIKKQNEDLSLTERAQTYKTYGDLLLAFTHRIPPKADSAELDNFFADPPEKVVIPLDPALSAADNAQEYYKKYKKSKRGSATLKERIKISETELEYLENCLIDLENADNLDDVEEIASALEAEDIYKPPSPSGKKKAGPSATSPRKYDLAPGYVVLVGRNSRQNDELSLRIAAKDDFWFHARGVPGSHVVLKIQKPSRPVPDALLYQAAQLAAFYSKAKNSTNVPVSYTRAKNIKKPKGAKPGQVLIMDERTIVVKPEDLPQEEDKI